MNKPMQTLIIWQLPPEETQLYLIPEVEDWVEEANDLFINGTANPPDALIRICDALSETKEHCINPEDPLAAAWSQYRIPGCEIPIIDGPVRVVQCGFFL